MAGWSFNMANKIQVPFCLGEEVTLCCVLCLSRQVRCVLFRWGLSFLGAVSFFPLGPYLDSAPLFSTLPNSLPALKPLCLLPASLNLWGPLLLSSTLAQELTLAVLVVWDLTSKSLPLSSALILLLIAFESCSSLGAFLERRAPHHQFQLSVSFRFRALVAGTAHFVAQRLQGCACTSLSFWRPQEGWQCDGISV